MKTKFFHLFADGVDSKGEKHTVTVVGKFEQEYIRRPAEIPVTVKLKRNRYADGKLSFAEKLLHRTLTIGVAICSPDDEFDEAEGVRIAKRRIERGDGVGKIETNDVTMITDDLIIAELFGKLSYITSHIDKYINRRKKYSGDKFDMDYDAIGI